MSRPIPPKGVLRRLREGVVIPAHPLALNSQRKLDERRQRALTLYYLSAGAGGIAVGVHTTQFKVHDPQVGLYRPLLQIASEAVDSCRTLTGGEVIKVAGVVGKTERAVEEAKIASQMGYHAALVSMPKGLGMGEMVEHLKAISREIAVFGFYLQPAVGGIFLPSSFWRRAAEEVENLVAIKVAPFNRYYTLDVVRGIAEAGRAGEVALYTGNDDSIVQDLVTPFSTRVKGETITVRIVGGLLGQWAYWTERAVGLFNLIKGLPKDSVPREVLSLGTQITDANGAVFDASNSFSGVIPGTMEVLRRSGLVESRLTLDPQEDLSPGQGEEIDRIYVAYPHLRDDPFVEENLGVWLEGGCSAKGRREVSLDQVRAWVGDGDPPRIRKH